MKFISRFTSAGITTACGSFEKINGSRRVGFVLFGTLALLLAPSFASAFYLPEGTLCEQKLDGTSSITLAPNQNVQLYKKDKKGKLVKGPVFSANVPVTFNDTTELVGKVKLVKIEGDPLGTFEGDFTAGSGTLALNFEGSDQLFPHSTITMSLLSGSLQFGLTSPGDQLTGPDGDNTFFTFTTHWLSLDPVGSIVEDGIMYDLVLGEFSIASLGRPSSFITAAHELHTDGELTIGEVLTTGDYTLDGTVTQAFACDCVPEPSSYGVASIVVLAGMGLYRKTKSAKKRG